VPPRVIGAVRVNETLAMALWRGRARSGVPAAAPALRRLRDLIRLCRRGRSEDRDWGAAYAVVGGDGAVRIQGDGEAQLE